MWSTKSASVNLVTANFDIVYALLPGIMIIAAVDATLTRFIHTLEQERQQRLCDPVHTTNINF